MCEYDYAATTHYTTPMNTNTIYSVDPNKETGADTPLISNETRTSWSGIVSPNGKSVAFLSAPINDGDAALYVVPINGGDPVKICDSMAIGRTTAGNAGSRPNLLETGTISGNKQNIFFLLDWK